MQYEFRFHVEQKVVTNDHHSEGIVLENIAEISEEGVLERKLVKIKLASRQKIVLEEELLPIPEDGA